MMSSFCEDFKAMNLLEEMSLEEESPRGIIADCDIERRAMCIAVPR
jgi:hypothetical protein